jgi:tRNA modification GTPase
LSTPPGHGGIAVIRVSGSQSLTISRRLCTFLPTSPESHKLYFGTLRSLDESDDIDQVLGAFFADGRSFTGEETVEISCHGGPVIAATILKELVQAGCRMARKGEFTYRAFMNGKLDLVQAESVLSLIESQTRRSAKAALRQLEGHLSAELHRIEDDMLWILAHLEASIDFSTEDIEVVHPKTLTDRTEALIAHVDRLLGTYAQGRILKEGLQIAIVGRPNAGKSSLLNAFVKEDRAIVTPIAGTTRDLIEGTVSVAGIPVTFVDTAGLRETEDVIEKIGIERTRSAMVRADMVFHVVDLSAADWSESLRNLPSDPTENDYVLLNKIDLLNPDGRKTNLERFGSRVFEVSATKGTGLEAVETAVSRLVKDLGSEASNVVTQARHQELLQKIHSCLLSALRLMKESSSPEFIAFELQESVHAIHDLLGKRFHEQVIDRIFKEFCLGK